LARIGPYSSTAGASNGKISSCEQILSILARRAFFLTGDFSIP
jgi:hypothetical protein